MKEKEKKVTKTALKTTKYEYKKECILTPFERWTIYKIKTNRFVPNEQDFSIIFTLYQLGILRIDFKNENYFIIN